MYRIEIKSRAQKTLLGLAPELQDRMIAAIRALRPNPRGLGSRKLHGCEDTYRLRIGDYRVIYEIHDDCLIVAVIKIGHRREVYR